jgi:hypothetical protein
VDETPVGRHILTMIDYFLDQTGRRLPMSLSDVQSPLSTACNLVNTGNFCLELLDRPEEAMGLLIRSKDLLTEFIRRQLERIGDAIVWPGHGFASCRDFRGLGISEDNVLMFSNAMYGEQIAPSFEQTGIPWDGCAFHSCGNWSGRLSMVRKLSGLRMVDGAFSAATDPKPNPAEPFRDALAHSRIVLNARIVGDPETIEDTVRRLWTPGMRLIVVTYCRTPEEQAEAYTRIHRICQG